MPKSGKTGEQVKRTWLGGLNVKMVVVSCAIYQTKHHKCKVFFRASFFDNYAKPFWA